MNLSILKTIIQNKHAYYQYFIEKKIEAGILLLGWEVKSIRLKKIDITNSYVSFYKKEAYLYNSTFQLNNTVLFFNQHCDPIRKRKLLLKKNELLFLTEKIHRQGYTITILDLHWKNSWIKAHIGIAKGKKRYDKRNIIHTHEWKNEKKNIIKYINK